VQIGVGPAHAYVAPPAIVTDAMSDPEIYVWGVRGPDQRHTMPRNQTGAVNWTQPGAALPTYPISTAGFRRVDWVVEVYLMMLGPSPTGLPADDFAFPLLVGAAMKQLALDLMAVPLVDPMTGDASQLVAIAERMEPEMSTPLETDDQRTMLYIAKVDVTVREDYGL
jgi:hypothetical protein